jgi:predicted amidohydrolase YtcJ
MKQLLFLLFAIPFFVGCGEHVEADLILYNAKVYTLDSNFSIQEAIAIKDGRIQETGSSHDIRVKYRAPKSIDLNKAFVYPGLIDAHCHFFGYAEGLRTVNLYGTTSWEEVLERIEVFQKKHQLDYVVGRGWDQNDWKDPIFPSNERLNDLFPNIPVVLTRIDGHALIANKAALMRDGITSDTAVEGGLILKTEAGELSGVLVDNACNLIKVPQLSYNQYKEVLLEAQDSVLKYGLTSLHDAGLERRQIALLERLYKADSLAVRLYAMVGDSPENREFYLNNGPIHSERLHVNSFKFYADGALGSRGACLLHPYRDAPEDHGLLLNSRVYFEEQAQTMAAAGWQMNTHAIGDSANRVMLQVYGNTPGDKAGRRWRIEHAQVLDPADFYLFNEHKVVPSVQPTHATNDMYWAKNRLGPNRIKDAYAYKRLLEQYGKIALGTDFPVEHMSPVKTFYAAVARKDASGFPEEGFQVRDALSREEALKGMTIWAAYAAFEEDQKGSIEPNKWADLTIMDKDWMTCSESLLLETEILYTYINGALRYAKKGNAKP